MEIPQTLPFIKYMKIKRTSLSVSFSLKKSHKSMFWTVERAFKMFFILF